jgi:hypothetical protein
MKESSTAKVKVSSRKSVCNKLWNINHLKFVLKEATEFLLQQGMTYHEEQFSHTLKIFCSWNTNAIVKMTKGYYCASL